MNKKECCGMGYGQRLNVAAVAMANCIAQKLDNNEIQLMSAFLQLVGEALAVIPAAEAVCNDTMNNDFVK